MEIWKTSDGINLKENERIEEGGKKNKENV